MAKTDKWPDKDIGKPNPGRQIVKADLCLTALWVISIVVMTTGCMLIGQWTLQALGALLQVYFSLTNCK